MILYIYILPKRQDKQAPIVLFFSTLLYTNYINLKTDGLECQKNVATRTRREISVNIKVYSSAL